MTSVCFGGVFEAANAVITGLTDGLAAPEAMHVVAFDLGVAAVAVALVPGGTMTGFGSGIVGEVFTGVWVAAALNMLTLSTVPGLMMVAIGKARIATALVAVGNKSIDGLVVQVLQGNLAVKAAVGGNRDLPQARGVPQCLELGSDAVEHGHEQVIFGPLTVGLGVHDDLVF